MSSTKATLEDFGLGWLGAGGQAAKLNEDANQRALQQSRDLAARQRAEALGNMRSATDYVNETSRRATDSYGSGMDAALRTLSEGRDASMGALRGSVDEAGQRYENMYRKGYDRLGKLTGLAQYGEQAAQGYDAFDAYSQRGQRLGDMMRGGMYAGYERSPGYEFQRQQGEQALGRQQAAMGGRDSGAALKRKMAFNQQLQGQDFANFATARQQQAQFAGQADAFQNSALNAQGGLYDAAQQQRMQNLSGLGQIGYGAMQDQAGMTLGFLQDLRNMYGQAAGQTASTGSQFANDIANTTWQKGTTLADMKTQTGQNLANIMMGGPATAGAATSGLMQATQTAADTAGQQAQAKANDTKNWLGMALALFSDIRLKKNLTRIASRFHKLGLPEYRWEWNDKAKELGLRGEATGVIAGEVEEIMPWAVVEKSGYKAVRYDLLEQAEASL